MSRHFISIRSIRIDTKLVAAWSGLFAAEKKFAPTAFGDSQHKCPREKNTGFLAFEFQGQDEWMNFNILEFNANICW